MERILIRTNIASGRKVQEQLCWRTVQMIVKRNGHCDAQQVMEALKAGKRIYTNFNYYQLVEAGA